MFENYLEELRKELIDRDVEDRDEILSYFEEMILDRKENGESEEEIISSLGSAEDLADSICVRKEKMNKDREDSRITLYDVSNIDIDVESYDVMITEGEGEHGFLTYNCNEDIGLDIEVSGSDLNIDQTNSSHIIDSLFGRIFHNKNGTFYGKLSITLPKGCVPDIELGTVSGDVVMQRVHLDDGEIKTVSGNIELYDMDAASLELGTVSGDISIDNMKIKEDLEAEMVSGNLEGRKIDCEDIEISSVSGNTDVLVEGNRNDFEIEENTLKRQVHHKGNGDGRMSIDTVSGLIKYSFTED